jgi:predicted metal-dependent enzyme (double-stranded beta helix superfamily)
METPPILEQLASDCQAALAHEDPRAEVHRLMQALFSDPDALASQIEPFAADDVETSPRGFRLGGEHIVHQSADLTVMVLDTLPGVEQPPHDHAMTAFIGVFEGCEEQRFWTRSDEGVVPTTGRLLEAGEIVALGTRAIHAISAPDHSPARAVHVYLGDIYDIDRSVFDPDTLEEHPMTSERYDEFCRAR